MAAWIKEHFDTAEHTRVTLSYGSAIIGTILFAAAMLAVLLK
ncbi:secretion protein [Novimethylophilus kurashikiensis]|uniref:Secretion protein n=1 Tax=Novimethylophilus kurashikiensis TaxID=1825523 RepID=A0A2R5F804_9PROT|nr:secretion protein [Novimethylophilus kurashikiensis]